MVLDVVYNHFGPDGYLGAFEATCTSPSATDAVGHALNFDGPGADGVRVLRQRRATG